MFRALWLFVVLLLALPVFAHASLPTKEQKAAIARLPEAYQKFLAEVEILITDEERATFLALSKDYQRDAFIQQFWTVRDDVKRTAKNELRERWEANLQQARFLFGEDLHDARIRAMLLNGPPAERVESNCSMLLYPLEVWFYEPNKKLREPFVLVLYRRWGTGPFKLWYPIEEGPEVFFAQSINERNPGRGHSIEEIAGPAASSPCGDDEHAQKILAGIRWVLANARDWIYIQPLIDEPPRPPGGEWVSAFNSYSTDVPAGTPPLTAKLDLAFPGRWQNRTVMQGVVTVPAGAAGQARLGEARSYNLLLNGELLSNGELFDSFRYKFDLPAAPADSPSEALPLAFERPLRPGDYTLVLKLEDVNSGRVYREERPLAVPAMETLAPAPSVARTPEEQESARILAEANAALRSGETTIKLIPPAGELQSGMRRFDTLTTGPGIDKVTFSLDGKPVLTKRALPFSVELDLGTSPRTRTLAVAAFDAQGNTLATDELQINAAPGNRFRVHLVEPQQGKRYQSSLLARAEVEIPEDETLERVEIYLNDARIATLYQPPWVHPVLLPRGESLAYVRAVAYLTDGSSAEHLVFVNAPAEMAQVNVDYVELYATVLDRQGRPVTADLAARDFSVSEDGVHQQIARCERVTDLPIHAAVAIDISASMEPNLDAAKGAALQFLQRMVRPRDRAEVITFNDHPALGVRFTRDVKALAGGLAGLKAERGTALYDSLIFSFYTFNGLKGRRALLLLSDGKDEGSRFTFEEALDFARRAGVTVYAIGLGDEVDKKKLAKISEETGGRAFFPRQAGELAAIYEGIEEELRSQILITYQSTTNRTDPGFRVVDLKVVRPGMEAKTMRGYYP
ncbi:MAG TPA: VWA domain-containing protein, partial [Thermoanaerobaculia bacterium]